MRRQNQLRAFGVLVFWGVVTLSNVLIMPGRHTVSVIVETLQSEPLALVVRAPGNLDAKASVTRRRNTNDSRLTLHSLMERTTFSGRGVRPLSTRNDLIDSGVSPDSNPR